jgi:hypothetical protein
MTFRCRVRKTIQPIRIRLVRPFCAVFVYSQDRIAKKKAPITRSAVCAWAVCPELLVPLARSWKNFRRSLGVMAFWRLGGGSALSKAFRRARTVGSNWVLPSM